MAGSASAPLKVSVVEDNDRFRESLSVMLAGCPGFCCMGTYRTAEEALAHIPRAAPDVILMDIELPKRSGIECVRELKRLLPKVPVMMLTAYDDPDKIFESLRAGACGYLLKRTSLAEVLEAIQETHRGGSPMSTQIARRVVASLHQPAAKTAGSVLTEREEQILARLAKGFSNKEIADLLNVSLETVRTHLRHIYEKLHVHSRTEAVVKYLDR